MRRVTDPRRPMHVQTHIVPGHDQWLASVNPDPHPDPPIRKRHLHIGRRTDRVRSPSERDKAVPLGPELKPTATRDRATHPPAMALKLHTVALAAELS